MSGLWGGKTLEWINTRVRKSNTKCQTLEWSNTRVYEGRELSDWLECSFQRWGWVFSVWWGRELLCYVSFWKFLLGFLIQVDLLGCFFCYYTYFPFLCYLVWYKGFSPVFGSQRKPKCVILLSFSQLGRFLSLSSLVFISGWMIIFGIKVNA